MQRQKQGVDQFVVLDDPGTVLLPGKESRGLPAHRLDPGETAPLSDSGKSTYLLKEVQTGSINRVDSLVGEGSVRGGKFRQFSVDEGDGGDVGGKGEAVGEGESDWAGSDDADFVSEFGHN